MALTTCTILEHLDDHSHVDHRDLPKQRLRLWKDCSHTSQLSAGKGKVSSDTYAIRLERILLCTSAKAKFEVIIPYHFERLDRPDHISASCSAI